MLARLEERRWACVIERIDLDENSRADPPFVRFALGGKGPLLSF